MRGRFAALVLGVGTAIAGADDADQPQKIRLEVGATTSREVGWAMGSVCDDDTIVAAEMRNKDRDTNVFVLKGLKPGTTVCRAGTYDVEGRPSYLFEITVVRAPSKVSAPAR